MVIPKLQDIWKWSFQDFLNRLKIAIFYSVRARHRQIHFLKQFYSNALWIDLLKPDVFRNYSARPERIIDLIHGNPQFKTIIVDEAQKVPKFLSAGHHLMKENKNLQFVLTGSSARKIKRKDVNPLGGRAL